MPSHLASGATVAPWTRVETRTAKNTILKNSRLRGTPSVTGKVARNTGSAPRSPAQPRIRRSRVEPFECRRERGRDGPGEKGDYQREKRTLDKDRAELAGENQQAQRQEERDVRERSESAVKGAHRALLWKPAAAEHEPGEIRCEEPRPAQHISRAVG